MADPNLPYAPWDLPAGPIPAAPDQAVPPQTADALRKVSFGLPSDNNVTATPNAPDAPAPSAGAPKALSLQEATDAAYQKYLAGEPLNQSDMLLIDQKMAADNPGKEGYSQTTSVSRQNAPRGAEWDRLQAENKTGLAGRNQIRTDQATNYGQLRDAQHEAAVASVADAQKRSDQLQILNSEQVHAQASYQAQLDKTMADQSAAQKAYMKAAGDFNPSRLMEGGKGILGAIALALGSAGAALTHTPNDALAIINDKINRDIAKQKQNLNAKKDQVSWLDHVMASNRSRFQDEQAARLATRANMLQAIASHTEISAAKLSGKEAQTRSGDMIAALSQQSEQDMQHARDLESARLQAQAGTTSSSTTSSVASTGSKPGDFLKQIKAEAETKTAIDKAYNSGDKLNPSEQKQVVDTNKAIAAFASAIEDSKRYQQLNDKTWLGSRAFPTSDDAHAQNTASTALGRNLAIAQNRGNLSENDVNATEGELKGGAWTSHTLNVKANELVKSTGAKIAADIASLPPSAQAQAIARLRQMVGREQADALLSGRGVTTDRDVGAAHGGR
jgi:hypothetical protein